MKKAVLLVLILTVAVISTACINNLAIQELNNNAVKYMNSGDYENAIDRLKSSIDLDDSKYETHYNLGIAYTKNEEYDDAIKEFEKVMTLNPDYKMTYFAMAVAYENKGKDIINPPQKDDEDDIDNFNDENKKELTAEKKTEIVDSFEHAVEYYNKYLEKDTSNNARGQVLPKIKYLEEQILKYGE